LRAERNVRLHQILERCAERLESTSGPSVCEINESLWDDAADLESLLNQAPIRRISAAN
jgi:hypothetical protein